MKKLIFLCIAVFALLSCKKDNDVIDNPKATTIVFTVIGDVPYDLTQREGLVDLISKHNAQNASEFIVHVGDIKPGKDPCNESVYQDVSTLLQKFKKPTFIVLGDNEYNDCDNPTQALHFWNTNFLHFNEHWTFNHQISYQNNRNENFS